MLSLLLLLACTGTRAILQQTVVSAMRSFCDNSATNVASILNWCTADDDDICNEWEGVTCSFNGQFVDKIAFTNVDLDGTWPQAFNDQITGLTELSINGAQFNGTLSDTFFERLAGTLTSLELSSTTLGFDIESLTRDSREMQLSRLTLIDTAVSGDLSAADPFNAPNLVEIDIRYSALRGELTDAFIAPLATHLLVLRLKHNAISGPAPEALCSFFDLQLLDLSRNRFNYFPDCYAQFDDATLTTCTLQYNLNCANSTEGEGTLNSELGYSPCLVDSKPNAKHDLCGECGGLGEECTDCTGEFEGTAELDACGECNGDNSTCTDCAGVVLGIDVYDECGVCGGNSSCVDCAGTPFGDASYDICDVCDGEGEGCIDCNGILFGTSKLDECGVCDGDSTSCQDCDCVPNGTLVYDVCDVCGGDGLSCVDCAHQINGTLVYDDCGVCGGDNSSCGLLAAAGGNADFVAWKHVAFWLKLLVCLLGAILACTACGRAPSKRKRRRRETKQVSF